MSVKDGGSSSMRSSKSEANSINSPETIAATILGATGGMPGNAELVEASVEATSCGVDTDDV